MSMWVHSQWPGQEGCGSTASFPSLQDYWIRPPTTWKKALVTCFCWLAVIKSVLDGCLTVWDGGCTAPCWKTHGETAAASLRPRCPPSQTICHTCHHHCSDCLPPTLAHSFLKLRPLSAIVNHIELGAGGPASTLAPIQLPRFLFPQQQHLWWHRFALWSSFIGWNFSSYYFWNMQ